MLNTVVLFISIAFFSVLSASPVWPENPDARSINKPPREKVLSVKLRNDVSLQELIARSGYTIADEDVASFLAEFAVLNEEIKSISSIRRGTTVKLPLQHLKKAVSELAISGETPGLQAVKRKIVRKKEQRRQDAAEEQFSKEMLLKNIRRLTNYFYGSAAVETEGFKLFSVNDKTEISLDTSYFPVVDLNRERILIVDYSGILPEDIKDIVELAWPEYRVVSFKSPASFRHVVGSLLESMGYNLSDGATMVTGGRTRIEYHADFLAVDKTGDIMESKIWIVGIVDKTGYATPDSLVDWFRTHDINLIELSNQETEKKYSGGADVLSLDSGRNAQEFTESVLSFLGYKYSSNTSHSLSDRKEFTYNLKADLSINLGYRTKVIEFTDLSDYEINFAAKKGIDIACIKPMEERRTILRKIFSLLSLNFRGSAASVSSAVTPGGVKYRLLSPGFFVHSIRGPLFFTDTELEPALLRDIIRNDISVISF